MDERLAERRRRVAEDRARSNLGRLVRLLMVVAMVGLGVWFVQSPFLSVSEISISGAHQVDAEAILARSGVVADRPMLLLDVSGAEAALEEEPWVEEAGVRRDWPTRVEVEVVERLPAANLELGGGWWLVASDGTLLESVESSRPGLGIASFTDLDPDTAGDSLMVAGAVSFLSALPSRYREARVEEGPEGLEATVAGFAVRLGRPFDMGEKAAVTSAMLDDGLEAGSVLTVVAPASPAVLPPGPDPDPDSAPDTTSP